MDKRFRCLVYLVIIILSYFIIDLKWISTPIVSLHKSSVDSEKYKIFDIGELLTKDERELVNYCNETVEENLLAERDRFRKNKQICRTHHTYMRYGKRLLIEVGGNLGKDAESFQLLYKPKHLILEPNRYYYENLTRKFMSNKRVNVLNFGLAGASGRYRVQERGGTGAATSIFSNLTGTTDMNIVNSTEFFKKIGVGLYEVDLLTLDCEGCEFEVLDNMFESNMVKYFKNIQMEWHGKLTGLSDKIQRYCRITAMLARSHRPTFQYKYWYEGWRRKDLPD